MGKNIMRAFFFISGLLTTFLVRAQDSLQKEKPDG
jgi:hypothetical protein